MWMVDGRVTVRPGNIPHTIRDYPSLVSHIEIQGGPGDEYSIFIFYFFFYS